MADDGGGEHCVRIELDRRVHELLRRDGGAEVMHLDAVLLDAAVLDVDDLAEADGVFILAHRAAHDAHRPALDVRADLIVAHDVRLLGNDELVDLNRKGNLALELDARAFRAVHDLLGNDLAVRQVHAPAALERRRFRDVLFRGEEHREHHGAVRKPFHLGADHLCTGLRELLHVRHAHVAVVLLIQLVDVDDLLRALQRAAADEVGRIRRAVLGDVVVAIVRGDGRHVVRLALIDRACADAACKLAGDTVAVALRVDAAVHEHAGFDRREVAALLDHLLHEEDRALLELPRLFAEVAVLLELDHIHEAVHADERLLGGVARLDVIDVPGHVAAFIRRDGGLNVRARELGDEHVEHVGHRRLAGGGFDVLRVHLRAHAVFMEQVAQRHGIGEVHMHTGRGRRRRRHGGKADVFLVDADLRGEDGVDAVLHHQLRHDLPGFARGGVGVVRAVDLRHARPGDELLRFTGVHKGTRHVDVAVNDVVLRVLMHAVHALFREHDGDIRAGNAGNIAVVVDGAAHFILDHVERLALRPDLLAGDRNAAHALRGALDEAVKVALPGGADDHDMIRAMVRCHAHAADIILKAAGSDLRGDDGHRLRVDVVKIMSRRQRDGILERLGAILIFKGPHLDAGGGLAPRPAAPAGAVILKVLQDLGNVDVLVGIKFIIAHCAPPLKLRRGFIPKPVFAKRKACCAHIRALRLGEAVNHVARAVGDQVALHAAIHDMLRFDGRKAHAEQHAALNGGRGVLIAHFEERLGDLLGKRPEALLELGIGKVRKMRAPFLIIVCPFHVGSSCFFVCSFAAHRAVREIGG